MKRTKAVLIAATLCFVAASGSVCTAMNRRAERRDSSRKGQGKWNFRKHNHVKKSFGKNSKGFRKEKKYLEKMERRREIERQVREELEIREILKSIQADQETREIEERQTIFRAII